MEKVFYVSKTYYYIIIKEAIEYGMKIEISTYFLCFQ